MRKAQQARAVGFLGDQPSRASQKRSSLGRGEWYDRAPLTDALLTAYNWRRCLIRAKTVLVLGAGASIPFGFQSSYELLQEICRSVESVGGDPFAAKLIAQGVNPVLLREFQVALKSSGQTSVDSFLEHRSEYIEVGKAALAQLLIAREKREVLFKRESPTWYEYLFKLLNARFEEIAQNNLSILTYNYDRSLEFFLVTATQNSHGVTREAAAQAIRSIPIVHLHGQLGELPELSGRGRPYSPDPNPEEFRLACQGIRVINEGADKQPQFQEAHQLLSEAVRVVFLGFSYDPTNVARLAKAFRPSQWVTGSTFGLTSAERARASGHLGLVVPSALDPDGLDCLQFLRNSRAFD